MSKNVYYTPQGAAQVNEKRVIKKAIIIMGIAAIIIGILAIFIGVYLEHFHIDDKNKFSYSNSSSYSIGAAEVEPTERIDVGWISGNVIIKQYDGDTIKFTETEQDDTAYKLRYKTAGDTLYIEYCKSGLVMKEVQKSSKDLTILVPQDITFTELQVKTVSGKLNIDNVDSKKLDIDYVSTEVAISGSYENLDFNGVSGKVDITNTTLEKFHCDFTSVSGDCVFRLNPKISGFVCDFDSVSGKISTSAFDDFESKSSFNSKNHKYGDGLSKIDFDAVSGSLEITKY